MIAMKRQHVVFLPLYSVVRTWGADAGNHQASQAKHTICSDKVFQSTQLIHEFIEATRTFVPGGL